MRVIEEIKISYFRSFSKETRIINFNDLNIISGKNDSGKSNILKALNLFFTEKKVDFYNDLNFEYDFSKQRSLESKTIHHKQLIQISILFNRVKFSGGVLPQEFWVEKTWNREGKFHGRKTKTKKGEILKHNDSTAKVDSSTTNFLKKIHFLYIPAIKDYRFFDYLKREYQQSMGTKISKMSNIDTAQKLTLEAWMEKLSAGDITDLLSQKIDAEADNMMKHFLNNTKELSKSNFNIPELDFSKVLEVVTENEIPLTSRGDGIQAKFIPQILNEITRNKKADIVIWGFEEPENSYEYANAQLLADKFKNEYSIDKQIFVTSHAFNFISLKGENISLFRAWKENFEDGTQVKYISNQETLFDNYDSEVLKQELGVLELNRELDELFKKRKQEIETELNRHKVELEELKNKFSTILKPLIITEGKSDWKHLKKAFSTFDQIDIEFFEYEDEIKMGSSKIESMIDEFKKVTQPRKIIFIFDRDENHIIQKYGKKQFNHHGNQVYSFCIPKVSENNEEISIEFYYSDNELKTEDENNRRLFNGNEFNPTSGISLCKNYSLQDKNKQGKFVIVDSKVFRVADDKSVALSKNEFADNILSATSKFATFRFDNFKLIFDVINEILKH